MKAWSTEYKMTRQLRIGCLISGSGTNLQAILEACDSGFINGHVCFVGSDNPNAVGLKRARSRKIPVFVVDYRALSDSVGKSPDRSVPPPDFDLDSVLEKQHLFPKNHDPKWLRRFFLSRALAEAELLKKMAVYPFDLLVLAGFMKTISPYFIDRVNTDPDTPRIMNIHPSLLPAFPGIDGYGDTFRYGCKVGGCTVHFVDYGEDSGPIIGQKAFTIEETDTLESVREKGLKLEWELFPICVKLFAEKRLEIVWKSPDGTETGSPEQPKVRILPEPR